MTTILADVNVPLDELLKTGGIHCVYQPFVDLGSGTAVAHEALLRGPAGTAWETPLALLGAARQTGRLAELEEASLRSSLADATRMSAGNPVTLFVNVEPCTLTGRPEVILNALAGRADHVQVVVEITERALAADLSGVLAGAETLRAAGCSIALDDVGVEPESLAFIPILRPEVVKLDIALLRSMDDAATMTVAGAVRAYSESSGAEVVAEGIETQEDLTRAMALGATLGQGWLWGRGQRHLAPTVSSPHRFAHHDARAIPTGTPFELISHGRRVHRAPKSSLVQISRTLELMASHARVPPLVISSFQHARHFTGATAEAYRQLATRLPFVAVLGVDMPVSPVEGVRGAPLSAHDPVADEWSIVVVGAHTSATLAARSLGDDGPEMEREFEFVVTYDRALTSAAARSLIGRSVSA